MEKLATTYYSDYQFCKEFGWTVNEVLNTRADYYSQFSLIMNAIGVKRENDKKFAEDKRKRKQH